jgi:glucose-6-phosphate dehydrogenase assembly protein OpcA
VTATQSLGTWAEENTSVGAVEEAVGNLRRKGVRGAVRTAVLTLVALVDGDQSESAFVVDTVREMSARHPTHAIVITTDPGAPRGLDAEVQLHAVDREGSSVCFEDVLLHVRGPAAGHLDSVVEPFTLPDLPCVVWLPTRLPTLDERILGAADRVIVDSRFLGETSVFGDLVAVSRRLPVTDLSWVRLTPWRELLAGLFEGGEFRPFVHGVRSVTVVGKTGPRHLLGGWLVSRLGLKPAAVHFEEGEHVSMDVVAEHDGRTARFSVERRSDEREVHASAEIAGGPSHRRTLRLRDRSAARVLGLALARMGHDPVWEQAVAAAVEVSGR